MVNRDSSPFKARTGRESFLLSRREAWISHDDGTTASLPAVLSRMISDTWIGPDGRLCDDLAGDGVLTPLRLAYGHWALAWRDPLDEPRNHYPYATVEPMLANWKTEELPVQAEPPKPTSIPVQLPGFADLYFIGGEHGPIKIGISVNPAARLRGLQTGYPYKLRILAIVREGGLQECEYHDRFAHIRLEGEWFERTPELLAEIERLQA